ncbi:Piso0_005190 [Millerozyma farinosa CBS 7064]|uniref:Piso0_005190 protein n=1 Tax=Pichia sorbitophila (strain ATCC MYA-4447 / BCRC 22081 / CBS 7064 / NBRC 10061 / NRRL Y-12695) TaxID=559304 RepID=G8Y4G3_PICSO|nr:Piso0_005190 [Millerozyma farinosa CBS 7064]
MSSIRAVTAFLDTWRWGCQVVLWDFSLRTSSRCRADPVPAGRQGGFCRSGSQLHLALCGSGTGRWGLSRSPLRSVVGSSIIRGHLRIGATRQAQSPISYRKGLVLHMSTDVQ